VSPAEREALMQVRGYAAAGRIRVSQHAWQRMRQRGSAYADVRTALCAATDCTADRENEKWKVTGPDLDGDALTCVVAIESGIVVVTLF
jgi:hypothetical protein